MYKSFKNTRTHAHTHTHTLRTNVIRTWNSYWSSHPIAMHLRIPFHPLPVKVSLLPFTSTPRGSRSLAFTLVALPATNHSDRTSSSSPFDPFDPERRARRGGSRQWEIGSLTNDSKSSRSCRCETNEPRGEPFGTRANTRLDRGGLSRGGWNGERRRQGDGKRARHRARGKGKHARAGRREGKGGEGGGTGVKVVSGGRERKSEGRGEEEGRMEREDAADAEQKLSPSPSGFAAARRGAFHPPFEPRATHHPRRRSLHPSRATTKPPYTNP